MDEIITDEEEDLDLPAVIAHTFETVNVSKFIAVCAQHSQIL